MSVWSRIPTLRATLSASSAILTDPEEATFQEQLKRWTNINLKTPAAIVLPTSEEDCQKTVKWAIDSSIPVVTRSGGHSEWSTIGKNGIIIDLSRFSGVEVNKSSKTATLTGGVLSKEVGVRLAEAGLFTALGNGNTVGAIPYFLGGGASITSAVTGFGSDQIISAHLITAKGDLLNVTQDQYPDLLWAIRGAGQFFGLVTQLVVRAHPLSALGNDKGVIWAGSFVFPLDRAKEVSSVMKVLMDDSRYGTGGLIMVMAPPPERKPSLVISARFIGDPKHAQNAYKALYDLGPIVAAGGEVPIQNTSDARAALGAKGDFKKFSTIGLSYFDEESFLKTIDVWKEMIAKCPDAINTAFNFQWDARPVKTPEFESAMCHHDTRYWQNNLIWYTDKNSRAKVDEYDNKSLDIMRGPNQDTWVVFQNATRDGPITQRYRGKERLNRLKALKRNWDPTGVFTDQLLV